MNFGLISPLILLALCGHLGATEIKAVAPATPSAAANVPAAPAALAAAPAAGVPVIGAAPVREERWEKIETRYEALAQPRQILSPGLFDKRLRHVITFPVGDAPVDLGLPHAGMDKKGKPLPPLTARRAQDFIWIDLDGDGKPGPKETRRTSSDDDGVVFNCTLSYENGVSAQYSFSLKTVVENEKYAVIRASKRVAEYHGVQFQLLDDDGDGKFNGIEHDALILGDQPVSFVGKYILLQDAFYELLVQPSGTTMELRPAPKNMEHGWIDVFKQYDPPQKSENLKIHTIILSGSQGSFSCDEKHPPAKVPTGAYDFSFALFERARETVYMIKGEKTSFPVEAAKVAAPQWGGPVKTSFTLDSDGSEVTVSPPRFIGKASEEYIPENFRVIPVIAKISQLQKGIYNITRISPFGGKRYELEPDGSLKPVVFNRRRDANDDYEVYVDYSSGVIGHAFNKEQISFFYKRKKKAEPKP